MKSMKQKLVVTVMLLLFASLALAKDISRANAKPRCAIPFIQYFKFIHTLKAGHAYWSNLASAMGSKRLQIHSASQSECTCI